MGEGTKEIAYATVDDIRQLVDCLKLVQDQLNGLQTQIELLQAKSLEEINAIVGKRISEAKKRVKEDPNIGLEGLHKMALEIPGHGHKEEDKE